MLINVLADIIEFAAKQLRQMRSDFEMAKIRKTRRAK